jgi:hypothetical protein
MIGLVRVGAGVLAVAALLAGCAGITSLPPGPTRVGGTEITLGRQWSDVSILMPGRSNKVRLLSIDGPLLNRLYVTDGLVPGDYLVKPAHKEQPTPVIRADMTVSERIEFVTDSVVAMDYLRVEASRPRPATLEGQPAVRFDISATSRDGLDVKGSALASEVKGKTYVVIYLAPAEHYYEATLTEAEAIMASIKARG